MAIIRYSLRAVGPIVYNKSTVLRVYIDVYAFIRNKIAVTIND